MNYFKRIGAYWNKPQHAAYLFVAPVMLILLTFTLIPMCASIYLAFTDLDLFLTQANWVGLKNFEKALSDRRFVNSFGVSVRYTLIAVPMSLILAMFIAALIARPSRFNKMVRTIYFLPVVFSSTATGIMWELLLNRYMGLLPYWAKLLGLPRFDVFNDPNLALPAICMVAIWGGFGMTSIIFLAAMKAIPNELYESAEMDGATKVRQYFSITFPEIMSTFWFMLITNIIGSLQVFDLIYIITDGGPMYKTETTVAYMFYTAYTKYKLGYASAEAVLLFLFILVLTVIMYAMMQRQERD